MKFAIQLHGVLSNADEHIRKKSNIVKPALRLSTELRKLQPSCSIGLYVRFVVNVQLGPRPLAIYIVAKKIGKELYIFL
jgi:hypothetical protein